MERLLGDEIIMSHKALPERIKPLRHVGKVQGEGIPDGTLKEQVFYLLNENALYSAKRICQILQIDYKREKGYIWKLRSEWKHLPDYIQGIKRISLHNEQFSIRALDQLDRKLDDRVTLKAIERGWHDHRARNKLLIWRSSKGIGWLKWWQSGKILGHCNKPASRGKVLQLLADAFLGTSLIEDDNLFYGWADGFVMLHGGHLTYDTQQRLPYARIEMLKELNGVVVTLGDKSHPTCVEIQFSVPTWAEKFEVLTRENMKALEINGKTIELNSKQIEQFSGFLKDLSAPKPLDDNNKKMVA